MKKLMLPFLYSYINLLTVFLSHYFPKNKNIFFWGIQILFPPVSFRTCSGIFYLCFVFLSKILKRVQDDNLLRLLQSLTTPTSFFCVIPNLFRNLLLVPCVFSKILKRVQDDRLGLRDDGPVEAFAVSDYTDLCLSHHPKTVLLYFSS